MNAFKKHPIITRLTLAAVIAFSYWGMHQLLQQTLPNLGLLALLAVLMGASAAILVMSFWPQNKA